MAAASSKIITLFLCCLVLLVCSTKSDQEDNIVKIDFKDLLLKYIIKFIKNRYVEGQNNAMLPLLDFNLMYSLYNASDASNKVDIFALANAPPKAPENTSWIFEAISRNYLSQAENDKFKIVTRLYIDQSIGDVANELLGYRLNIARTSFAKNDGFIRLVDDWIRSLKVSSSSSLVHDFDLDNSITAFLVAAVSLSLELPLSKTGEKTFLDGKVAFLEGIIQGKHAKITDLKIEVLEPQYDKANLKVWFILPDGDSSMNQFINLTLATNTLTRISSALSFKKISVSIPLVSIDYNSQEDSFLQNVFQVFTSLFSNPSIRLSKSDTKYSIKDFLMKCVLRLGTSGGARTTGNSEKIMNFDRPFIIMVLHKNDNIPLLVANYYSVTDKMHKLEEELALLEAQEKEEEKKNAASSGDL